MNVKKAEKTHAKSLAHLNDMASAGIPRFLWTKMAKGVEDPLEFGAKRIAGDEGTLSYRNSKICTVIDEIAGMIVSYKQDNPYKTGDLSKYPEVVLPFVELESEAPGSWYINAIATFEQYRGMGIATELMKDAERVAIEEDCTEMSLIVSSENRTAKRFYTNLGYRAVKSIPVIPYEGSSLKGEWILMTKNIHPG